MKRILVFSDTHGDINYCIDAISRIPAGIIIHAGDYVRDAEDLISIYPDKDIRYVKGNNDLGSKAPRSLIIELDGVKIFVVHGHEHRVKYELHYNTLAESARNAGCDMAVFGHTHISYDGIENGVRLLNPGSVRFGGTYAIIEIEDGVPHTCIMQTV